MAEPVLVETGLGKLAGYEYTTARGDVIYTFEGIPYAKHPVGDLRFKSPVPVEKWEGIKEALKPGNKASSLVPFTKEIAAQGDEDCLHLSIYTPQKPQIGLKTPVMVWFHGGGFTFGNSLKETYGPDYLVPYGVIIVSINYRLGPFGFLSLQTPSCPGNFGLKDQTLALRWVKDHIADFGGDPDNVTIFGESAGGASVHYHLLSPSSKGLFHRAIAQSAAATNRWAYSRYPRQSALLLAQKLGCTSEDPEAALVTLRAASAEDILISTAEIFEKVEGGLWAGEQVLAFPFVPTAEPLGTPDPFITRTPWEMVASGDFNDVPYVTGATDSEGAFVLPSLDYVPPNDDEYYQKMLLKELEPELGSEKALEGARRLRKFYFPNGPSQEGYVKALSMNMFAYGVGEAAEAVARKKKAPTYLYIFSGQKESSLINLMFNFTYQGTAHAQDLEFLWWVNVIPSLPQPPIEPGTKDSKISENICKLWTDFAKTGTFETNWPAVEDDGQLQYLHIGEDLQVRNQFFGEEIKFWDDITVLLKK